MLITCLGNQRPFNGGKELHSNCLQEKLKSSSRENLRPRKVLSEKVYENSIFDGSNWVLLEELCRRMEAFPCIL